MSVRISLLGLALALHALPVAAEGGDGVVAEAARVSVGVAPFEVAGPSDAALPDFATLLADLLGTRGVGRIVGPDQLGAPASTHVDPSDARAWAEAAMVEGVVVGRTTQLGSRYSVDVQLCSAQSGEVVDTYIAEIARTDQTTEAIAKLADQVIAGVLALSGPADSPAPPAARSPTGADPRARVFDSSSPISIRSNALEAAEVDGGRRLVFSGDVNVVQDDITLTSNRLEADYARGASEPSRLVAQGAVRVVQGSQEARCDSGTYQRAEERLLCCGNAELRDGASRVRGKCIEFDLGNQTVHVQDAVVNIIPEPANGGVADPGGHQR